MKKPTPEYEHIEKIPKVPTGLSKEAQSIWKKTAGIMIAGEVLTVADLQSLQVYSITYAQFMKASRAVDEYGVVNLTEDGRVVKSAAITAVSQLSKELRALSSALGLDPKSRGQIGVNSKANDDDDPWKQFV